MTLVRRSIPCVFALLSACVTLSAAETRVPDGPNSSLPLGILLVGESAGITDPAGEFTVVIRDLANNPMAGVAVLVDFGQCGTDMGICTVPGLPGEQVSCLPPGVVAITGITGTAHFAIRGGSRTLDPSTVGSCARVWADGVFVGSLSVGAFDLNGQGGVGPPDISRWLSDYFKSATIFINYSRSDYDFNGTLGSADLALLLRASLRGHSAGSCSSYCN